MNFSNYRLSLDIHETESGLSLRAKKGDTIRKIYVTLMDGGVPYRITPDCTAAFTARKPDNTVIFNDAVIENNAIVYELTPQTTAAAGQVRCEVRLYGGDGRLITSPRFFLDVDDTVFTEGDQVVSEDEYTILEDAIEEVHSAVLDAQAALDQIAADFKQRVDSGEFTDAVSGAFLHKTGGAMSGDIAMGGHKVTGLGAPTDSADAATKEYADAIGTIAQNALPKSGGTMTGPIAMGGKKVTGLGTPADAADAATKGYVDGRKTTAAVTISAENWFEYYGEILNAVALSGVTDDNTVIVSPAKDSREAYLEHGVFCAYQRGPVEDSPAGLAFICESVPGVDLTVNVVILE
ncbi:MAG: BppU family phage baseplate upper protein [Faecousia sp.]